MSITIQILTLITDILKGANLSPASPSIFFSFPSLFKTFIMCIFAKIRSIFPTISLSNGNALEKLIFWAELI